MVSYKLGELIEKSELINRDLKYGLCNVRGISNKKQIIPISADMEKVPLNRYLLGTTNDFIYVPVTSRNGERISISLNTSLYTYLFSGTYIVFRIKKEKINTLIPKFLFLYFYTSEFDRIARFNSWGSARESLSWDDLCDLTIKLPPIEIQQKFVDIYDLLQSKLKSYEKSIDNLNNAYLFLLSKVLNYKNRILIKDILKLNNLTNVNNDLKIDSLRGINDNSEFMLSRDTIQEKDLDKYKILKKNNFAINFMCLGNFGKFYIAKNDSDMSYLVSPACHIFQNINLNVDSNYLMCLFKRGEFQRLCSFKGDINTRGGLNWEDFSNMSIPVPSMDIQASICNIYLAYKKIYQITRRYRDLVMSICSILIKGSLEKKYE